MSRLREYFQEFILFEGKSQWLIDSLVDLDLRAERVACFGCGEGRETLTLMYELGAEEGVGIDIDLGDIKHARGNLKRIQEIISVDGVPDDVPGFLKRDSIEEAVKFYEEDITKPTRLSPDYYDLVFCNFVLYHIGLSPEGEMGVRKAIKEMVRTAKPGGLVAGCEPTQYIGDPRLQLDLVPLLQDAELTLVRIRSVITEQGEITEYIYVKELAG